MLGKTLNIRVGTIIAALVIALFGFMLGSSLAHASNTKAAEPLAAERQQWEYLIASYSQLPGLNPGDTPFAEYIQTNDPAYDQELFGDLICTAENPRTGVCRELLRGMGYYLNLWGAGEWELVSVINTSTAEFYRVEMVFKRPS